MAIKHWNVLSWNIRGINSDKKWNAIRDHLSDSNCDVICLQETKRESFDLSYLRNFCPTSFDSFVFLPSAGPQVAQSSFGEAIFFLVLWFFKTLMLL
jgi:mRNA deadenylase 3'-5' endonuclease subunit Ccr4